MKLKLRFSGRGGQGIKFLGSVLVRVAMAANYYATLTVDYTPSIRGGLIFCDVVLSSDPISYPFCDRDADIFIAIDQKGFPRASECTWEKTVSFIDVNTVDNAEEIIQKGSLHRVPTCAADCPTNAITMTNFTDVMILRQIDIALRENSPGKVLIFACNWCSYTGADLSGTSRIQYPSNIRIVRTMCSGRVHIDFIKHCFKRGTGVVMLTGCHPQDCHYISGNDFAIKREKKIRNWMRKNNIDYERFIIEWISAAEGKKFAEIVSNVSKMVVK